MLALGVPSGDPPSEHQPNGASVIPGLTFAEARTHFGAWCIVSSPLVLSHDAWNDAIADAIWGVISNQEAIAVNQAWAGFAGGVLIAISLTQGMRVGVRSMLVT